MLVCECAADIADIEMDGLIEQSFFSCDVDQLDDIFLGYVIELAALETGIAESIHADMCDRADFVGSDITQQFGKSTLGQVVGFQLVVENQLAELGDHVVVAADDSLEHAFVCEVVSAAPVTVALCCRIEKCQITGMAGLQKALLQSLVAGLGHLTCYETGCDKGHAVLNKLRGICCADNRFNRHG